MKTFKIVRILILPALLIISACAHHQKIPAEMPKTLYSADSGGDEILNRYAPLFVAHGYSAAYNRIGRPAARYDKQGNEQIYIDSENPVIYYLKQNFTTKKGSYTNLIYRVHFSKIPFSLIPFNLTAGSNVGLIVVITLDSQAKPVLVTTVNTCGCYKAIVPTSFLPGDALPLNWPKKPIMVYGEKLPWQLEYPSRGYPKALVHIRPGVHRVMDLEIAAEADLKNLQHFTIIKAPLKPARELERIPLGNTFTSFYYEKGPLKGHVKGSVKFLESIFLSLPSLDLFVGADKVYGDRKETGNPFYTSLKPWNRNDSDMGNFARFLEFWGWRL